MTKIRQVIILEADSKEKNFWLFVWKVSKCIEKNRGKRITAEED